MSFNDTVLLFVSVQGATLATWQALAEDELQSLKQKLHDGQQSAHFPLRA